MYSAGLSRVDAVSSAARANAMLPPLAVFSFASCPPADLPRISRPLWKNSRSAIEGSGGASAPEALASDLLSVSVSVSVSGGVSETFRLAFLKRCTRSVETSDLYCRAFQLWGVNPVSVLSSRPAVQSCASTCAAFSGFIWRVYATWASGGSSPPCFDDKHIRLNHARNKLSLRSCSLGSVAASSYALHQRLTASPSRACRFPGSLPVLGARSGLACAS